MHAQMLRLGKRVAIAIAGGLVVLVGAVLSLPLVPGPGLAIVVLGLAILSLEFETPRIWMARLRVRGRQFLAWIKARGRQLAARIRPGRSPRGDG